MVMKRRIDWVPLSPLLLLLFLPLTHWIGEIDPDRPYTAVRYFSIPLAGFSVGACIFIAVSRGYLDNFFTVTQKFVEGNERRILVYFSTAYLLMFALLPLLRYLTYHVFFFDFGIYDTKIWQISDAPLLEKFSIATTGHFQPVLMLYSVLYNLNMPPVGLQILQALAVTSGIIPLYLLVKKRLERPLLIVGIGILYFLYPPTQFNTAVDFHPDHLFIPLVLWALYFLDAGKYLSAMPFIIFGFALKESLMLSMAFLGLYMVWEKKDFLGGALLFTASIIVFYFVSFLLIPQVSGWGEDEWVTKSPIYAYLPDYGGIMPVLNEMLEPAKSRFPFFVLFPLLFIPLIRPKEFLPALPTIGIAMFSTSVHHQNVASHYTASIIPPVFFAMIYAVVYLEKRFNQRVVFGLLSWVLVLIIFFNIAHSPSPLAVAFWDKTWSNGRWHYSNYIRGEHEDVLEDAIGLVPDGPDIKVVTHSGVYHEKLAHGYFFKPFPERWREADYIILDNKKGPYLMDDYDEDGYWRKLKELKDSPGFKKIFDKDDIVVFRKWPA